MKIEKFRVKNYKSIIDSMDCYPGGGITILAGKNEAGKTSLLEALEDFNIERQIRAAAKPIQDHEALPAISITYRVDEKTLNEICKACGALSKYISNEEKLIDIEKVYPNKYSVNDEFISTLPKCYPKELKTITQEVKAHIIKLKSLASRYTLPQVVNELPDISKYFDANGISDENALNRIEQTIAALVVANVDDEEAKAAAKNTEKLLATLHPKDIAQETFTIEFLKRTPHFILFSSFSDVFPNKIAIESIKENEWIKDLSVISNLDVETIQSGEPRDKRRHKERLNIKLNEDFKKFWEQDLSKLAIDWDNENLYFWIEENGESYEPEIRSQGRRWHLAFYIRVTARAREEKNNIILIDEPGLYLHAKAQKDILKNLDDAATNAQVIFSTHSPYLLETDKLDRVRLIIKTDGEGTIVENKIHKGADKETLTPIMTAIGLEMTSSISDIDKLKNVIVEGPSDYFYLNAFKRIMEDYEINFVFGGGAGNMPFVGTILQGWGCQVIFLYDNDQGHRDGSRSIRRTWRVMTQEMIQRIPIQGGSIEDILSKEDYKRYVLKDEAIEYEEANSEYAATNRRDKVLDSKLFKEQMEIENIELTESTRDAAIQLLSNFRDLFSEATS
jgi:AAA15 family ATPase/GTPase